MKKKRIALVVIALIIVAAVGLFVGYLESNYAYNTYNGDQYFFNSAKTVEEKHVAIICIISIFSL